MPEVHPQHHRSHHRATGHSNTRQQTSDRTTGSCKNKKTRDQRHEHQRYHPVQHDKIPDRFFFRTVSALRGPGRVRRTMRHLILMPPPLASAVPRASEAAHLVLTKRPRHDAPAVRCSSRLSKTCNLQTPARSPARKLQETPPAQLPSPFHVILVRENARAWTSPKRRLCRT